MEILLGWMGFAAILIAIANAIQCEKEMNQAIAKFTAKAQKNNLKFLKNSDRFGEPLVSRLVD